VLAWVVGLRGAIGVLGWVADVRPFRQVLLGAGDEVRFTTALTIALVSLSTLLSGMAASVVAAAVLVIAVSVLVEYASGSDVGLDQAFLPDDAVGAHPGRMAVATAVCFAVFGLSRIVGLRGRRRLSETGIALVGLAGVLITLGYLFQVRSMYREGPFDGVALHTAVALVLLSLALLAVVPRGGMAWVLRSPDAGAQLLRSLVPFAFLGIPVIGYICLQLERHHVFNRDAAVMTLVVGSGFVVTVVAWAAAQRLGRVDRSRLRAIDELTRLTDDLENQVLRRASQLQQGRAQLAILEDRNRIASDLHDIVIQRLFAAGMYLEGGRNGLTEPRAKELVDSAVEAMDTAIKDLRASIFELGTMGDGPKTIESAVGQVCWEASRVLGFVPTSDVIDLDGRAEPARDDILAVLREALSNVTRHAHATQVEVSLTASARGVELTVEDDGIGMGTPERASGTANIRDRARRWAGDCVWEPVDPHGTRVRWTIPDPVGNSA
jgi:signal transduction histidine kinase